MSGNRLHEAINAVIIDQTWATYARGNQDPVVAGTGLAVDAILAMPEMEAIRQALLDQASWEMCLTHMNDHADRSGPEDFLLAWGLPESVIDWVLA